MIDRHQPRWPGPGNAIAVAAPAGAVEPQALQAGLAVLSELAPDCVVRAGDEVLEADAYLAGPDQERAARLDGLLRDQDVAVVMAARGGFGASRLLPLMDLPALAAARGCLIGFSDLTCLLNALAAYGLITVHGPVITQLPRLDDSSRQALARLLSGCLPWPATHSGQALTQGRTQGPLMGGNLTTLCHLLGTPWFPSLEGAVLFLEEVNEPAYRLDRLVTQLELAGVLGVVAGVAVGRLSQESQDLPELVEVIHRRLQGLSVPVLMGLPFGHGAANQPLPLGAMAEIDADAGSLTVGADLA